MLETADNSIHIVLLLFVQGAEKSQCEVSFWYWCKPDRGIWVLASYFLAIGGERLIGLFWQWNGDK